MRLKKSAIMIVWELREGSNGELKPYHSIMEPQPSYPVLDYEDETRRDRLQLFQAKNCGLVGFRFGGGHCDCFGALRKGVLKMNWLGRCGLLTVIWALTGDRPWKMWPAIVGGILLLANFETGFDR